MEDYKEMSWTELKQECKKKGLDSIGKKVVLIERLEGKEKPVQPVGDVVVKTEETTKIVEATQSELERFLPQSTFKPVVDCSKYEPWLTSERLQGLENKLRPLAAGKGSFKFELDRDNGAFWVEFSGHNGVSDSTTLIDNDAQIVSRANHYFTARLVKGTDGAKSRI